MSILGYSEKTLTLLPMMKRQWGHDSEALPNQSLSQPVLINV